MTVRKLPASRGLAWFSGGLLLLRGQAARLLLIGLILQFLSGFTQLGALGILFVLAIPALTAGMMHAMSIAGQGMKPPLVTLFIAFTSPERLLRLFLLSAVMIAAATLAAGGVLSGVTELFDPEMLVQLEQGNVEVLAESDPALVQRLALAILVGLLISGSLAYFAIPLVWFHDRPAGSAILEGLVGMFKNWLPLLVLGGLLAVMSMPVALIMVTVLAAAASGSGASTLLTLVMLLVMVAYQLLLFSVQYLSFRDVFGAGKTEVAPASADDQLVA